ncbi:MAG TPA: hypothetical protein VEL28_07185 [Candidatus Binatia bacterium]|nr:hypothetical protein [Candidatus Binatia bacterium]
MKRSIWLPSYAGSRASSLPAAISMIAALMLICSAATAQGLELSLPNDHPEKNSGGKAATFSTHGSVELTGEFFQAQGSNGRSCASCHIPGDAWAINPGTLQDIFDETGGTDPVFNILDANNPDMDVSTPEARLAAFSMMLSRGVFRRGGAPRADAEWELVAADDPHGFASVSRLVHWRRPSISRSAARR